MSYKKNFLDKVIVRCDVLDLFDIRGNCPDEFKKALRRMCPIEEEVKKIGGQIQITPEGVRARGDIIESKLWNFTNIETGLRISLSEDFFLLEYSKYESIDLLIEHFQLVERYIGEYLGKFTSKRLGLRYIDVIGAGDGDPLGWRDYITENFLVTTSSYPVKNDRLFLSRAFNRMEYAYEEMKVILQYGIHNPDYPAPIKARQYILDTDVISIGLLEMEELEEAIKIYHVKAKEIFESAITEKLRGIMNA